MRRRGFTLMEVMIVAALLGVVMLVVGPVMAPAGRVLQRADMDTRAQQTAVVGIEKLFHEIGYTDSRGVTIQSTPLIIAYPSSLPPSWSGLPVLTALDFDSINTYTSPIVWQKFSLILYDTAKQSVLRKDLPYPGGDQLATIKASRLSALASNPAYPTALIASDVKSFAVDHPTQNVLRVDLTISQTWDQERITHLQTEICMRN